MDAQHAQSSEIESCSGCLKRRQLCVCDALRPIESKVRVLFLQHPQEPDKDLGTAFIAHRCLPGSCFRIGLSWPNLSKALGETAEPKRWGVLYLGSSTTKLGLSFVNRKGIALPDEQQKKVLDGIVVLDGTWSQAKTLWWRNAWLLKLNRLVINAPHRSLYGNLRKEPRRESLSTIEATAFTLEQLGALSEPSANLLEPFRKLLERAKERKRD